MADPATTPPPPEWEALPEFTGAIEHDAQAVVVAATGGAKSTLVASLTLPVASLVAIDAKGSLVLPRARIAELPTYSADAGADGFGGILDAALSWQDPARGTNRVILRPSVLDIEGFDAHDAIFRALYLRGTAVVWIDEVTATGATANRVHPWLRALSARGRTRGIGLWTCTQRTFDVVPMILRTNATYLVVGPLDPDDAKGFTRPGIGIATRLPRKRGLFLAYVAGEREPYKLHVPIPPALARWQAP